MLTQEVWAIERAFPGLTHEELMDVAYRYCMGMLTKAEAEAVRRELCKESEVGDDAI